MKTKHLTAFLFVGRARKLWLLLCTLVVVPVLIRAADDVEITVELASTWKSQTKTNHHSATVTCIVGTNGWFISGDLMGNARVDYWLVGTNVIEHRLVTSNTVQDEPDSVFAASYPAAGETFTTIHSSPLGQPVFHGMEGVVWLAFCSGDYLKQSGRQIPMPIGPSGLGFGYSDRTVLFEGEAALPKSVKLFATDGTPVCDYQVLSATNFIGRTFPLQFRVFQLGQPAGGSVRSESTTDLEGRVKSIRFGKRPELPAEVRKKVQP